MFWAKDKRKWFWIKEVSVSPKPVSNFIKAVHFITVVKRTKLMMKRT